MKGDFSRQTFRKVKHYAGVLMQQGRVAVDADWNEQQAITRYRIEAETKDVIGFCGTPLDPPAFTSASGFAIGLTASGTDITVDRGRYYVDGLLCENEAKFDYLDQGEREFPAPPAILSLLPAEAAVGLVYLDAWQRHLTKLDDGELQEQALGDVDTTTRVKTTWQVRVLPWPSPPSELFCGSLFPTWDDLKARASGTLTAVAVRPTTTPTPCEPPPSAGFTRLENQLYRVEVHKGSAGPGPATFKWSRENGSILASVSKFEAGNWLTVDSVGRDEALGFAEGQWVELVNDRAELDAEGKRLGQLFKVNKVNEAVSKIRLDPAVTIDPALNDLDEHPKLRRWDQMDRPAPDNVTVRPDGTLAIQNGVEVPLEDGVRVRFDGTTWQAGDYWLIPARTASGDIEWPRNGGPLPQPPVGVAHHLCKLAIVRRIAGEKLELVSDCRDVFPPLTALTTLVYLGGDGQEVMPVQARNAPDVVPLPEPLRVGVVRGGEPVPNATVRFALLDGAGLVDGKTPFDELQTDAQGVATCEWQIASNLARQHVEASLRVNGAAAAVPIVFSATRSIAEDVRYFPPDGCEALSPAHDIQAAIDRLAALTRLNVVSGSNQEVMPVNRKLPDPLRVRVANDCGPVKGATVTFAVKDGGGSVTPGTATTDASGLAEASWTLGDAEARQHLEAKLTAVPNGARGIHGATATIEFVANLSVAEQVAYTPKCEPLVNAKVTTVWEALEALCQLGGKGREERGVRILDVLLRSPEAPPRALNDHPIPVGLFAAGFIEITCERTVDDTEIDIEQDTVRGRPTCFVTLQLPYPISQSDRELWRFDEIIGYQPIVLAAEPNADGNVIYWSPTETTRAWLASDRLRTVISDAPDARVLCWLTLKGNFIWARQNLDEDGNPGLYLDGEAFGTRRKAADVDDPTDLWLDRPRRPGSGDDLIGGDFETWFYLTLA